MTTCRECQALLEPHPLGGLRCTADPIHYHPSERARASRRSLDDRLLYVVVSDEGMERLRRCLAGVGR